MTDANRNLAVRIASAAVFLPVVLFLVWRGPGSTAGLLGFVAGVLAFEYYSITLKTLDGGQILGIIAAASLPVLLVTWPDRFPIAVAALAGLLPIALLSYYLLAGPLPEAPGRAGQVFIGVFYCGLLLATVGGLRALPDGLSWVLLTLMATWMNDTGAYAAGRLFGKRKLYLAVSPGKTWEGFYGGVLSSLAAAFLARALFLPSLTASDCLFIGLPCAVLGPLGDLSESMVKRAYGVKDSGKIMPGHGGLLDRVDALLFNAPFVYAYLLITRFG